MAKNVITDILKEINALPGLSVDNVIEKIENEMKTRYEAGKIWPDTFENWKEAGFDVNYKWYNDKALLHYAAEGGRERVIDALIQNGANIEVEDKYRNTPLHYAAANGHVEVAKTLIDKGADVNKTGGCEATPLHYAVECGHMEAAKVLINKGAKVNVVDRLGCTPLFFAIENDLVEIAKTLRACS
ncbi:ankyrin repeat domain-containing protein [Wolbachia endosymbiont (group A) of Lasioglossum fulvicorne]|uniref:ankyrin repeat domain-containing protein n=1 Tax=Wolbachia endosymbiont (group A) of Lasioglossum fulvicorne TaxID=3066201 RepID=UPI00334120F1